MRYRVRRADCDDPDDLDHLKRIHKECFEGSAPIKKHSTCIFSKGAWWLMYPEDADDDPMGFCGVAQSTYAPEYAYLKRGGVLPPHRGQGLQGRLIRVREKWARGNGFQWMITDTTTDNPASANSLIRAGYRLFWPQSPWGLKTAVYLRKALQAL